MLSGDDAQSRSTMMRMAGVEADEAEEFFGPNIRSAEDFNTLPMKLQQLLTELQSLMDDVTFHAADKVTWGDIASAAQRGGKMYRKLVGKLKKQAHESRELTQAVMKELDKDKTREAELDVTSSAEPLVPPKDEFGFETD